MNDLRRKKLTQAIELMNQAREMIEEMKNEEENCFLSLTEGLQATERGLKMEENYNALEESIDELQSIIENIEEIIF